MRRVRNAAGSRFPSLSFQDLPRGRHSHIRSQRSSQVGLPDSCHIVECDIGHEKDCIGSNREQPLVFSDSRSSSFPFLPDLHAKRECPSFYFSDSQCSRFERGDGFRTGKISGTDREGNSVAGTRCSEEDPRESRGCAAEADEREGRGLERTDRGRPLEKAHRKEGHNNDATRLAVPTDAGAIIA